jgi:hypothetical protein
VKFDDWNIQQAQYISSDLIVGSSNHDGIVLVKPSTLEGGAVPHVNGAHETVAAFASSKDGRQICATGSFGAISCISKGGKLARSRYHARTKPTASQKTTKVTQR